MWVWCVGVHTCHSIHVVESEQLYRVRFLLPFMDIGVWTQVTRLLWQLPFSVKPPPCLAKTALSLNAPALFLGREALLIWLCFGNLVHVSYLAGPFAITFFLFSQLFWLAVSFASFLCIPMWLFPFPTPFFLEVPLFLSVLPSHLHHLPSPWEYLSPLLNSEPL